MQTRLSPQNSDNLRSVLVWSFYRREDCVVMKSWHFRSTFVQQCVCWLCTDVCVSMCVCVSESSCLHVFFANVDNRAKITVVAIPFQIWMISIHFKARSLVLKYHFGARTRQQARKKQTPRRHPTHSGVRTRPTHSHLRARTSSRRITWIRTRNETPK